jgi:hypothetical protein
MRKYALLLTLSILVTQEGLGQSAQAVRKRFLHVSLVPGLSSNGIHGGRFRNSVSLNLLSGYSAGNDMLELGGLSNFNQSRVYGLQLAGLVNVVGGNAFNNTIAQIKGRNEEKAGADVAGIQAGGLMNFLTGSLYGFQAVGGVNIVREEAKGLQVAGLVNVVNEAMAGVQVAGVQNTSFQALDGGQVAGIYNYTNGAMQGFQVSAFNQARSINGRRSVSSTRATGLQLGLVNSAGRSMAGYQIGLVNFGGEMSGTQIGLVNINKSTNGTPIGLFTVDSEAFIRVLASELFLTNLEIGTGTRSMYNTVSISYNAGNYFNSITPKWAVGYSLGKIWSTRSFFVSTDVQVQHINLASNFTKELSLSGKVRASVGLPVNLGFTSFYLLSGLTWNSYVSNGDSISPDLMSFQMENQRLGKQLSFWPGFTIGIQSK